MPGCNSVTERAASVSPMRIRSLAKQPLRACANLPGCGRPRPQQLQRALSLGIASTRVAVQRCCARGRAHSVRWRLCRAELGYLSPALPILAAAALTGCQTAGYYAQAVRGHCQVLA